MIYTAATRASLRFAEKAHRGRVRKGTDAPYALHPVAVATLLAATGAPEEVIVAAYLHDVVEDEDVTIGEIAERFGSRVAELVAAVTERKEAADGTRRTWRERKDETIAHLAGADAEVLLLKGADVCANITDVVLDHAVIGDAVWDRFRAGPELQVWYYGSVADAILGQLTGYGLLRTELKVRLAQVRALVPATAGDR